MNITTRQHIFTIREPFAEGTIITRAEAQALNYLRAENIRNNTAEIVAKALADAKLAPGEVLPVEAQAELQRQITEYDLKYQFQIRPGRASGVRSALEIETQAVATELVETQIRASGAMTRAGYEAALAAALALPAVQAEARRRVAAANQAAAKALQELL